MNKTFQLMLKWGFLLHSVKIDTTNVIGMVLNPLGRMGLLQVTVEQEEQ